MMTFVAYGQTDIGKIRKLNEDSLFMIKDKGFFVVADGMGGHKAGDQASTLLVQYLSENLQDLDQLAHPADKIKKVINDSNIFIKNKAKNNPEMEGMGTTLILLQIINEMAFIANVGDSRAYLISNEEIFQLSVDHTLIQEKINMGIYTYEQALKDPMKNVLVHAIGHEENVHMDLATYAIQDNDIFLLCSDGLTSVIDDQQILSTIKEHVGDQSLLKKENMNMALKKCGEELIRLSNERSGHDNISVILVSCHA